MTDGDIDIDKVRAVLRSQGMTLAEDRDAFQLLVQAGYTSAKGKITASGIQKIADMNTAREAEVDRLGLRDFLSTGYGQPNEALLLELSNKDY